MMLKVDTILEEDPFLEAGTAVEAKKSPKLEQVAGDTGNLEMALEEQEESSNPRFTSRGQPVEIDFDDLLKQARMDDDEEPEPQQSEATVPVSETKHSPVKMAMPEIIKAYKAEDPFVDDAPF